MRDTAAILLDKTDEHIAEEIRDLLGKDDDVRITDLHVWQIGPEAHAAIVSVVTTEQVTTPMIRDRLLPVHEIRHLTVGRTPI